MKGYVDIAVAAERMGVSRRRVQQQCLTGELPGSEKRDGQWRIPPSALPTKVTTPAGRLEEAGELTEIPERKRREALKKLGIIREFYKFETALELEADKTKKTRAVGLFAAQKNINEKSFYRWLASYRMEGLRGLVDGRGGGKFIAEIISPDAFDLFKRLWLDLRRPSLRQCWLNLCFINKQEKKGWRIPNQKAMYRFVKENIPYAQQVLLREGTKAYEARCAPYIERDPESVEPGAVWVGDHSQFNCWMRDRGQWIRPWITAWEDMRSRKIVGFHISPCPSQTTILQAFKRAVEEYGPPEGAKIDNGKDYDSEMWTGQTKKVRKSKVLSRGYLDQEMIAGIYAMMNVTVSFAIPYNAKSKPVERFFATLDSQFTKTIETYCSPDTKRRPEDLCDKLENETTILHAYDLAGFGQAVGRYIEVYNNTAHTGAGMDGRSPAEAFETGRTRRVLAEGAAALLLRALAVDSARLAVRVSRGGVSEDLTQVAANLRAQADAYEAKADAGIPDLNSVVSPSWEPFSATENLLTERPL